MVGSGDGHNITRGFGDDVGAIAVALAFVPISSPLVEAKKQMQVYGEDAEEEAGDDEYADDAYLKAEMDKCMMRMQELELQRKKRVFGANVATASFFVDEGGNCGSEADDQFDTGYAAGGRYV